MTPKPSRAERKFRKQLEEAFAAMPAQAVTCREMAAKLRAVTADPVVLANPKLGTFVTAAQSIAGRCDRLAAEMIGIGEDLKTVVEE